VLPPMLLLVYAIAFGIAAFGAAQPAFDDHPGQFYRLAHVITRGSAPWAWTSDWWAGYPELQFYPPGFFYLGLALRWLSLGALSVAAIYQVLLWITWLAPGAGVYALLARQLGSGWAALPGTFIALTLSTGVASGVEGGVHIGMLPARLGWALLPLLAVALVTWMESGARRAWELALVTLAAIVLIHPAHLPAAGALVVVATIAARDRRRRALEAAALLGGAALLTVFWTLPLIARLEHTRALAWGRLTVSDFASLLANHPLLVLLILLALPLGVGASPERRALQWWPWATALVVLIDAAILETVGLHWLPADRVVDGMWMAFIVVAGLNVDRLVQAVSAGIRRMVPRYGRAAMATAAVCALVAALALGLVNRTLFLWPRGGEWPSYVATARGLNLDALWSTLASAPEGRVLFVRSGVPLVFGTEWWRPHTHVTALTPLSTRRGIVNGTFTHPSPVAALVYRGSPERGAITTLVERLDGVSLFGRSLDALDAGPLNAWLDRLGISVIVGLDDDLPRLGAVADKARFVRRASREPFVLYERRGGVRLPIAVTDDHFTLDVDGAAGQWVSTRTTYYPLWRAERAGVPLATRRGPAWDLEVKLDGGHGPVELVYSSTWVERGGATISLLTIAAWLASRWWVVRLANPVPSRA